jgi:hypothetical protein
VTTVPHRADSSLPATLTSLARAGFTSPLICVDEPGTDLHRGAYAHWALTLTELVLTRPLASLYAVFQDDVLVSPGLRGYVVASEASWGYGAFYYNCCLYPSNLDYISKNRPGHTTSLLPEKSGGGPKHGWHVSNQLGRGAQALVFPRDVALTLLSSREVWRHPETDEVKGRRGIDGLVSRVARARGFTELVHYPSLAYHSGRGGSTIRDREQAETAAWDPEYDPRTLLGAVSPRSHV